MAKCSEERIDFGRVKNRAVEANFSGGDLTSDGGLMLLGQTDRAMGLSAAIGRAMALVGDSRQRSRITHQTAAMLTQRLYGLCMGHEDLNDHDALRGDLLMQTAVGVDRALASAPTLCRLENRATPEHCAALGQVLFDQFIEAHKASGVPEQIVLDIDASDVPLHGQQERSQFHGYYNHYCYLPLYVFCGKAMLACYLRRSRIDGAKNATALLKRLVEAIRAHWPAVRIIIRGDSGFCRQRLLDWCETNAVFYVIGVARNARLQARVEWAEYALAEQYAASGVKVRLIDEFPYAAQSWAHERRVVTRLEYGPQGTNPRFVVSNLTAQQYDAAALYDGLYCQRGEAENRIKEAQLDLFGTRASCQRFIANQFRLLLAALAYTLMNRLKALALTGTELANASAATVRTKLLKLGACVIKNTRRVIVMFASTHPLRELFALAATRLNQLNNAVP
jgi:Transposase DDE domain group 1